MVDELQSITVILSDDQIASLLASLSLSELALSPFDATMGGTDATGLSSTLPAPDLGLAVFHRALVVSW